MEKKEHLFKQEGYDFMAAAFEVYNELKGGMAEEIYQESLEIELADRDIAFLTKPNLRAHYKGKALKRKYVPDLVVFGGIVVELKAVSKLLPDHTAQLCNYMRISKKKVGYLVNFGDLNNLVWERYYID